MNKKIYMTPAMESVKVANELPLCVSPVSSSNGAGYGGVDTDGTKDPSANMRLIEEDMMVSGEEVW